jgi:hopanoid biosynthesis associated RND transporter like protein HpnN
MKGMTSLGSDRVPRALAALALRLPWTLVTAAALMGVLALWLAATRLEFQSGHTDLISAGNRYRQLESRDRLEFENVPGRVVVAIQGDDPEPAKAFATALAGRWAHDPKIERVLYRIDLEPLKDRALWYLAPDQLATLHRELDARQDQLAALAGARSLHDLFGRINQEITTALVGRVFTDFLEDEDPEAKPPDFTLVLTLLRELSAWLDGARTYRSPWAAALAGQASLPPRDGYLWSDDRRLLFILADPQRSATDFNRFATAIKGIRDDIRDLQRAYPGIEVGLTGRAVIEADEMGAAQRDMTLATVVSVLAVAALFVAFFKGLVRPAIATLTLALGLCWSMGFAALTVGHLNILTIVFVPMLVGLGDHSIHFIARFEEERAARRSLAAALRRTFSGTGIGIVAAAGTTACAFAMLVLTGFKGLMELGVISAAGILLSAGATLTLLPALLVLDERRRGATYTPHRDVRPRSDRVACLYRYPRSIVAASTLLAAGGVLALAGVRFDGNLLQLQAHGTESIVWAERIARHTRRSVLFDEVVVGSLDEARAKAAALAALPSVADVDSVLSVLPRDTAAKRDLIRGLGPLVAALPVSVTTPEPVDVDALRAALGRIRFKMVEGEAAVPGSAEEESRRQRQDARGLIERFLDRTARMEAASVREALALFQAELFRDFAATLETLKRQPDSEPVTIGDLPPELRARYVGKAGHYRLFVYPAENVWEYGPLTRFVTDLQSVDPDAHGTTVTTFEYLRAMKEGYTRAALYAGLGAAGLALVTFRAIAPALLALVPLALGTAWTLGLMAGVGMAFNAANLLLLPLIVGVGIDNGIYLVHRVRERQESADERRPLATSAAKAITLASLTNIVGFGSLMVSSHRGIWSLGFIVAIGVFCLWVASVTTLPSLLSLFARREASGRIGRVTGPWADRLSRCGDAVKGEAALTRVAAMAQAVPPDRRTAV